MLNKKLTSLLPGGMAKTQKLKEVKESLENYSERARPPGGYRKEDIFSPRPESDA